MAVITFILFCLLGFLPETKGVAMDDIEQELFIKADELKTLNMDDKLTTYQVYSKRKENLKSI